MQQQPTEDKSKSRRAMPLSQLLKQAETDNYTVRTTSPFSRPSASSVPVQSGSSDSVNASTKTGLETSVTDSQSTLDHHRRSSSYEQSAMPSTQRRSISVSTAQSKTGSVIILDSDSIVSEHLNTVQEASSSSNAAATTGPGRDLKQMLAEVDENEARALMSITTKLSTVGATSAASQGTNVSKIQSQLTEGLGLQFKEGAADIRGKTPTEFSANTVALSNKLKQAFSEKYEVLFDVINSTDKQYNPLEALRRKQQQDRVDRKRAKLHRRRESVWKIEPQELKTSAEAESIAGKPIRESTSLEAINIAEQVSGPTTGNTTDVSRPLSPVSNTTTATDVSSPTKSPGKRPWFLLFRRSTKEKMADMTIKEEVAAIPPVPPIPVIYTQRSTDNLEPVSDRSESGSITDNGSKPPSVVGKSVPGSARMSFIDTSPEKSPRPAHIDTVTSTIQMLGKGDDRGKKKSMTLEVPAPEPSKSGKKNIIKLKQRLRNSLRRYDSDDELTTATEDKRLQTPEPMSLPTSPVKNALFSSQTLPARRSGAPLSVKSPQPMTLDSLSAAFTGRTRLINKITRSDKSDHASSSGSGMDESALKYQRNRDMFVSWSESVPWQSVRKQSFQLVYQDEKYDEMIPKQNRGYRQVIRVKNPQQMLYENLVRLNEAAVQSMSESVKTLQEDVSVRTQEVTDTWLQKHSRDLTQLRGALMSELDRFSQLQASTSKELVPRVLASQASSKQILNILLDHNPENSGDLPKRHKRMGMVVLTSQLSDDAVLMTRLSKLKTRVGTLAASQKQSALGEWEWLYVVLAIGLRVLATVFWFFNWILRKIGRRM